jgi:lipopolysaccharide/colanic/teichoic acid biosynthesis glycosyltransferase
MLHNPLPAARTQRSLFTRVRFAAAGALILVPLVPLGLRYSLLQVGVHEPSTYASLVANAVAVIIAVWMRISLQPYPGTRAGAVLLPAITIAHLSVLIVMLMARLPYDRVAMVLGYIVHLVWSYGLYITVQRRLRQRIAVVPIGQIGPLQAISSVDWYEMRRPDLDEVVACDAIVADFAADLPPEWEAFLANAAIEGRVVFQVKQLSESLTGRVDVEHLSENSFGSLVPMRIYTHIKSIGDWLFAVSILPVVLPVMVVVALLIRIDSRGPALFLQQRVGRGGRPITVYKFRTMRWKGEASESTREAAMTLLGDPRITRMGRWLRTSRLDELPQILNILRGQMSWIGPRPEAALLSVWYADDVPFYRYRYVVKPGISGWAQVNQGHVANVDEIIEKLQLDFFYIK